jgi:hypothetical protein
MPKNTRRSGSRKNRRTSRPNVFAQKTPVKRAEDENQPAATATAAVAAPRTRARVERTTRRAGVRSEIYTRSLAAELKKMGALASVIVVVLAVLTFVL